MGLISYWKLEDLTDEQALHDIVNTGGADQVADGYDFDGSEYMTATDTGNDYDFIANQAFTIVIWMKARAAQTNGARVLSKYLSPYGFEMSMREPSGKIWFAMKSGGSYLYVESDNTYDDNAWHMLAFRRMASSTTIKIWADDGESENKSGIGTAGTLAAGINLFIGCYRTQSYYFDGIMGNVLGGAPTMGIQVYDTELSDADLLALYEAAAGHGLLLSQCRNRLIGGI